MRRQTAGARVVATGKRNVGSNRVAANKEKGWGDSQDNFHEKSPEASDHRSSEPCGPGEGESLVDGSYVERTASPMTDILGRQLKRTYGLLLEAPVPERFHELLRELEARPAEPDPGEPDQGEDESAARTGKRGDID